MYVFFSNEFLFFILFLNVDVQLFLNWVTETLLMYVANKHLNGNFVLIYTSHL